MSQSPLRLAFRASRPLRSSPDPTSYLRLCRACRIRLSSTTSTSAPASNSTTPKLALSRLTRPSQSSPSTDRPPRRPFTTTPAPPSTLTLLNPRHDDSGAEMTITISERAAQRLRQITSSAPQKNTLLQQSVGSGDSQHLRVTVTSGGCHGFQYLMSLEGDEKIDGVEDTVFEYAHVFSSAGSGSTTVSRDRNVQGGAEKGKAEVVLDSASLELLKGSTIDFTQELIGSSFKVVGNPRATSSCGCGTSFDIE